MSRSTGGVEKDKESKTRKLQNVRLRIGCNADLHVHSGVCNNVYVGVYLLFLVDEYIQLCTKYCGASTKDPLRRCLH